jgi:putative chitinase
MDRKFFFDHVRIKPFGGALTGGQVDGLTRILDEWDRRALTDLRWLADILGQSFWESGKTMQPVREKGGEAYLKSKKYYPWVGEGLIQVTWEENHRKFGATAPGQLMTWPIALRALFDGMIKGMFTGKKLADYFNDKTTDWVNARRIVNGTDRAEEIAGYAKDFYQALIAAKAMIPPPPDIPAPPTKPIITLPPPGTQARDDLAPTFWGRLKQIFER